MTYDDACDLLGIDVALWPMAEGAEVRDGDADTKADDLPIAEEC